MHLYLGHRVGGGVVRPEKTKLLAIQALEVPQTKKNVRTFLGITGYYRRFIPNYSSRCPSDQPAAPNQVVLDAGCTQAYESLKKLLCEDPILHNPNFDKPFILQTGASERGVGAVLSQQDDDGYDHPVAYYSHKFLPREQRYSTVEKECLAIKLGVQAFRVYLLGRKFTIQTDHHALVWLDRTVCKKTIHGCPDGASLSNRTVSKSSIGLHGSTNGNADMHSVLIRRATNKFVTGEGGRRVMDQLVCEVLCLLFCVCLLPDLDSCLCLLPLICVCGHA